MHDCGQEPGPEAVPTVELEVFGTVRKGEQAEVAIPPGLEAAHDGFHPALADAVVPQARTHGQRSKEPDAAPVGGEVRSGELAVDRRGEGGVRIGGKAGTDIVGGPERISWSGVNRGARCFVVVCIMPWAGWHVQHPRQLIRPLNPLIPHTHRSTPDAKNPHRNGAGFLQKTLGKNVTSCRRSP
jgi:hypothetical protein